MNTRSVIKRIILALLLVLILAGAFLSDPLIRFSVDLYLGRYADAHSVYSSRLAASQRLEQEAADHLRWYVDHQLARYYRHNLTSEQIMGILTPLSQTNLPQADIKRCFQAVEQMDAARADLVQADISYAESDYARAIPLFRQAIIAEDAVAERLSRAEAEWKNQLLEQAEAAMDAQSYEAAETVLLGGLDVLEADVDLTAALADVRRLEQAQQYDAITSEARRLLQNEGPAAAFRYIDDLRQQAPDEYELAYLEQTLRHEYEEEICNQAFALQAAGDPAGACTVLEDGLTWIDSERVKALRDEIRTAIPVWLVDLPVLRDETESPRTGANSTIARDQVHVDILSNVYEHSFSADTGSVSFSLQGDFATFTGTVAFPMGEKSDIYRESATLQIYADGVLAAEFKAVDGSSAPFPFSLPVENVQEITLRWTCEGANGWKDWGRFATIFDGRLIPPGGQ